MAHDVFISYARQDRQTADVICRTLEKEGIACWYAPRDVPFGVDYEEAVVDALGDSRLVLLILSSHSNNSPHVRREIQNACAEDPPKPILPVRVENVSLNKALRYYLSSAQWLDASAPPVENHLPQLVAHLRARLARTTKEGTAAREALVAEETKASLPSSESVGTQAALRDAETADKRPGVNGVAEDAAQLLEAVRHAAESQRRRAADVRPAVEEKAAKSEQPAGVQPTSPLTTSTRSAAGGKTPARLSLAMKRTLLVVGVSLVCLVAGATAISYRLSAPVPWSEVLDIGFFILVFLLLEGVLTLMLEKVLALYHWRWLRHTRWVFAGLLIAWMINFLVTWNNYYVRAGLEVHVRNESGNYVERGVEVRLFKGGPASPEFLRAAQTSVNTPVDFYDLAPGTYTIYVLASPRYNLSFETVDVDERKEQVEIVLNSTDSR